MILCNTIVAVYIAPVARTDLSNHLDFDAQVIYLLAGGHDDLCGAGNRLRLHAGSATDHMLSI